MGKRAVSRKEEEAFRWNVRDLLGLGCRDGEKCLEDKLMYRVLMFRRKWQTSNGMNLVVDIAGHTSDS